MNVERKSGRRTTNDEPQQQQQWNKWKKVLTLVVRSIHNLSSCGTTKTKATITKTTAVQVPAIVVRVTFTQPLLNIKKEDTAAGAAGAAGAKKKKKKNLPFTAVTTTPTIHQM